MVAELRRSLRRIPRGVVCGEPHRPQRRRHRSVDAVAYGGGRRAYALRHLAGRRDQAGSGPAHGGAARPLPGFEIAFSQPIIDSVLDYVFDPHSSLAIKVFGDDFDELRRIGKDIVGVLNTVPGVTDAAIDQYTPLPQIAIKVDRAAAARYGINVADVADLIRPASAAAPSARSSSATAATTSRCASRPRPRNSPEAIRNLVLTSSDGALIPLSQVADIKLQTGESMINRDMNHRYLLVKLNYLDREPLSVMADVKKAIDRKVAFDRENTTSSGAASSRASNGRKPLSADHRSGARRR